MREEDVIVVGAGLSGICAAYYLAHRCDGISFKVLEGRENLGGTWDLFKYPGIRSDSDMYTLGFSFHPWPNPESIADGESIMEYLHETVESYDLLRHIQFSSRVVRANWSSKESRWILEVRRADGEIEIWKCKWLWGCTGYYRYESGYMPDFPGAEDFAGELIHPQLWSEDVEWRGKRVVVIGSGATAVTLVPAMAAEAEHVTMLQRSPTYIMALPEGDRIADAFKMLLPEQAAHDMIRWKNILVSMGLFQYSRLFPEHSRGFYINNVREAIGEFTDVDRHFSPDYKPWDQRLCLIPNADLFKAIRRGDASVVTEHISRFVPEGIELQSGEVLEADLVVAATGLQVQVFGGASVEVDGEPIEPSETMMYRGTMLSGVPNFCLSLGYTNASWTLKCELTSRWVCRLLRHMKRNDLEVACAYKDPDVDEMPLLDLNSGYIHRASGMIPAQGSRLPWRLYQNYILDKWMLERGELVDKSLKLT